MKTVQNNRVGTNFKLACVPKLFWHWSTNMGDASYVEHLTRVVFKNQQFADLKRGQKIWVKSSQLLGAESTFQQNPGCQYKHQSSSNYSNISSNWIWCSLYGLDLRSNVTTFISRSNAQTRCQIVKDPESQKNQIARDPESHTFILAKKEVVFIMVKNTIYYGQNKRSLKNMYKSISYGNRSVFLGPDDHWLSFWFFCSFVLLWRMPMSV